MKENEKEMMKYRPYRTRDYGIWETEGKKVRLVREGK